jgi:SAM-dependent methyltransferase
MGCCPAVVDIDLMTKAEWQWDPTLYAGSAHYYADGRVPYPDELADKLAVELGLDGRSQLLDIGSGPGSLTLLLAPYFEHVTAVDADPQMLAVGQRQAAAAGITNVEWVHCRAEDLAFDPDTFRLATLAQSFHWMDQPRVAGVTHGLLTADGALVHVHATTHERVDGETDLPHPQPPRGEIEELITQFLGSRRRAGRGYRPETAVTKAELGWQEAQIYRAAGFVGPVRIEVPGRVLTRSVDQVVASVFSLSYAAPHLFAEHASEFERDLRALLADASPDGQFSEQTQKIAADIWRP